MSEQGVACPAMGPIYRHDDYQVRYIGNGLRQDHLLFQEMA